MDQGGDEDVVKALTEEVGAVVATAEQMGGQVKRGGKRPPERGEKVPDTESGEEGVEGCEEARRSEGASDIHTHIPHGVSIAPLAV